MRPHPSLHSNFFSSLKQVEKRLKLEEEQQQSQSQSSLSSPIYLHFDQSNNNNQNSSTPQQSSELPQQFLSCSPDFPLPKPTQSDSVCDIEKLIQLLGLSENCSNERQEEEKEEEEEVSSCHCENGFYSKIAQVKGPKCGKEVERLEGWIRYFLNGGGNGGKVKIEPFRLSLLILGKASFVSQGGVDDDDDDDSVFGGLEFPSTIEEFLLNDPPPTTT